MSGWKATRKPDFELPGSPPVSQACVGAFKAFVIAARYPRGFTVEQLVADLGLSRACAYRYRAAWDAAHGVRRGGRGIANHPDEVAA